MTLLRIRILLLAFCMVGWPSANARAAEDHSRLFWQSAAARLDKEFAAEGVSWLLLDADGKVQAVRWKDAGAAVPPGSLVKPFVALAYGEQHHFVYPHFYCAGTSSHCWKPSGHGRLGIEEAIAQSCNAYFLQLAATLDAAAAARTLSELGLQGPPAGATPSEWIGLGGGWKLEPAGLARGYLKLAAQGRPTGWATILDGLRSSAANGTAHELSAAIGHQAALAKTGTAPCVHQPRGAGDGLTMVLYPAEQPRMALLVRVHNATGAQTAALAGRMLHALGAGVP